MLYGTARHGTERQEFRTARRWKPLYRQYSYRSLHEYEYSYYSNARVLTEYRTTHMKWRERHLPHGGKGRDASSEAETLHANNKTPSLTALSVRSVA
eukprot:scaffold203240_cov46-Prasinocladus_malaysianus.AAC.2